MNIKESNTFVKSHGVLLPNGQVFLTKPLYVFKKIYGYRNPNSKTKLESIRNEVCRKEYLKKVSKVLEKSDIYFESIHAVANLIIPVGSLVNLPRGTTPKFRADKAFCWSIVEASAPHEEEFLIGCSGFTNDYLYTSFQQHQLTLPPRFGTYGQPLQKGFDYINWILSRYTDGSFYRCAELEDNPAMCLPLLPFDKVNDICGSGIHFYLEVKRALNHVH